MARPRAFAEASFDGPDPWRGAERLPESRLAVEVLLDALDLLNSPECAGFTKGRCPAGSGKCTCIPDARDWLLDTETDAAFSLRGVCAWISFALGHELTPESIAERVRSGVTTFARPRRSRGGGRKPYAPRSPSDETKGPIDATEPPFHATPAPGSGSAATMPAPKPEPPPRARISPGPSHAPASRPDAPLGPFLALPAPVSRPVAPPIPAQMGPYLPKPVAAVARPLPAASGIFRPRPGITGDRRKMPDEVAPARPAPAEIAPATCSTFPVSKERPKLEELPPVLDIPIWIEMESSTVGTEKREPARVGAKCLAYSDGESCELVHPEWPMTWCSKCWDRARRRASRETSAPQRIEIWDTVREMFPGEYRDKDWLRARLPEGALGLLVLVGSLKTGPNPLVTHALWHGFGLTRAHLARLFDAGLWHRDGSMAYEWLGAESESLAAVGLVCDAMVVEGELERLVTNGVASYQMRKPE